MFHDAESLENNGLWVFPIGNPAELELQFDASLKQQPELLDANGDLLQGPLVGGGFAALGNASSYHTTMARTLRIRAYEVVKQHYRDLNGNGKNEQQIEIVPDRQSMRYVGLVPSAETWHRDLSPTDHHLIQSDPTDIILGGWINCNTTETQKFVCVPGSHTVEGTTDKPLGFQLLSKDAAAEYKKQSVVVEIPPGHALAFNQSLVHCVNPTKLKYDMKRLYVAHRISAAATTKPMIRDIVEILMSGAIVPMKSGQLPPMFPRMWLRNWPEKLIEFSQKFGDAMKEVRQVNGVRLRTRETLPNEGEYLVLRKHAPAMPVSQPYSETEIAMHLPHSIHL